MYIEDYAEIKSGSMLDDTHVEDCSNESSYSD